MTQHEVEQACMKAAGWDGQRWPQYVSPNGVAYDRPKPLTMKMNHGELVQTGWENCLRAILQGVATLVGPA